MEEEKKGKKKKIKVSHGKPSRTKYNERHHYVSKAHPRRKGGKWIPVSKRKM